MQVIHPVVVKKRILASINYVEERSIFSTGIGVYVPVTAITSL